MQTRIIEPFSCVEIHHVAELIDLPYERVESKLAEMILDKKLSATLDQGQGQLIVFDEIPSDVCTRTRSYLSTYSLILRVSWNISIRLQNTYANSLETIRKMDTVMDALVKRAEHLK